MKAALPNGLDGLFENVGGEPFRSACAGSTISPRRDLRPDRVL